MVSKKFKLILSMIMLLSSGVFAQSAGTEGSGTGTVSKSGYDVFDSSVVSRKKMPQQNEFWNHNYNFPAKPRNMWEVGVSAGMFNVVGDVPVVLPTFGFGAHVRKAFGYVFSMRLQYMQGTAKGLSWLAAENFGKNKPVASLYSAQVQNPVTGAMTTSLPRPAEVVYYNYKNETQDLSLQGIITLNNVRFHKQRTGFVVYGGAGVGATAYKTMLNLTDASGNTYSNLFQQASQIEYLYSNRKDIKKLLKDGLDDSYETPAQTNGERRPKLGDKTLRFSTTVLAGVAVRLSKRINIALENRHTFVKDDLLDGQQWQEHPIGNATTTGNWDSYNYASLGINFNLGAKSVEPLWWINPLDYVYGELSNPRLSKQPKPVLDDTDGDGVIDQLDREPNTPAGTPVDTHGVSRDTDGDGVPDSKDKELVTPTTCQPVDADGIGKCPDPECCKNIVPPVVCDCNYPTMTFANNNANINANIGAMLATIAAKMKANPTCAIILTGYPEASKASQANCQKRLEAARRVLIEKEGISADRITVNCEIGGGDKNAVDVKCP